MNPDRALDFLDFVQERHRVWEARQAGLPQPWTQDPILATRKFTNVFRVLDPGSQFVLTDLDDGWVDKDVFAMRCFLYRHTNLPSAWRAFAAETGEMPHPGNLEELREFWHSFGGRVFSGAYMIYPQSSTPGTNKVESIIDLTQRLWKLGVFQDFVRCKEQGSKFKVLRAHKGVADFMSYQILTDYGYSTDFREDEFMVPGPGARKGAAYLSDLPAERVVEWAYQTLRRSNDCPSLVMPDGRIHKPSMLDCQNLMCEYSKYFRYQSRPLGKPYQPAHPGPQPPIVWPVHW